MLSKRHSAVDYDPQITDIINKINNNTKILNRMAQFQKSDQFTLYNIQLQRDSHSVWSGGLNQSESSNNLETHTQGITT
jgi:hypothetical protein